MIPAQDPKTCIHHIDMNSLIVDQIQASPILGGGRRVRLATECQKCRSLVTLDEVFERMMSMVNGLAHGLARLERTVYGVAEPQGEQAPEPAAEPAPEG